MSSLRFLLALLAAASASSSWHGFGVPFSEEAHRYSAYLSATPRCIAGRFALTLVGAAGAGTSNGVTTVERCADCPHGKFQPAHGKRVCEICDGRAPLWSVTNAQRTRCEAGIPPCALGRYFVSSPADKSPIDLFGCAACAIGRYQDQRTQTECKACTAPMRRTDALRKRCDDQCPPGTYHQRGAAAGCARCAVDAVQGSYGQRFCTPCVAGMSPNLARTRCLAKTTAAPATFAPKPGSETVLVGDGKRCNYTRGARRFRCERGLACSRIGLRSFICKPPGAVKTTCAAGRYISVLAQGGCANCAAGFYQPEEMTTTMECLRCAAARFSSPGAAECAFLLSSAPPTAAPTAAPTAGQCKPGTFRLAPDLPCTGCPAHHYQPLAGQTSCNKCPQGASSSADRRTCISTSHTGVCGAGQALRSKQGNRCSACSAGRFMPFASHSSLHCYRCHRGCTSKAGAKRCTCTAHKAQDCKMSPWSGWAPCEGGTQVRTSIVLQPAKYGGAPCSGSAQTRACTSEAAEAADAVAEAATAAPSVAVRCAPGTYHNRGTAKCIACYAGSVQPLSGQHVCNACRAGTVPSGDRRECITAPAPLSAAPETAPSPEHCTLPPTPAHGRISLAKATADGWVAKGTKAAVSCVWPFTLSGQATRVCLGTTWSGVSATCLAPDAGMKKSAGAAAEECADGACCPLLPEPQHGELLQPSRRVGAHAALTCTTGYKRAGSARRICKHDLTWSGTISFCYRGVPTPAPKWHPKECEPGTYRERGGHHCAICPAGTVQPQRNQRFCNTCAKGMTNDANHVGCIVGAVVHTCPAPSSPSHGAVKTSPGPLVPGATATYTCDHGYAVNSDPGRSCSLHLRWTGYQPLCVAITTEAPKPVSCSVSLWSRWSPCTVRTLDESSKHCNKEGVQMRERLVLTHSAFGGKSCPALSQMQSCSIPCEQETAPPKEKVLLPSVGVSTTAGGVQHISFGTNEAAPTLPPTTTTAAPTALICKPGQYHLRGVNECALCPPGTFQLKSGQRFCDKCPVDHPITVLPARVSCTKACTPGHMWAFALGMCSQCAPGAVSALAGAPCERCPVGRHSNNDHTACHKNLCAAGSFHARDGQSCKPCPTGQFQNDAGQQFCKRCPAHTVANESRTACLRTLGGRMTRTTAIASPTTTTTTVSPVTTVMPRATVALAPPPTTAAPTTTVTPTRATTSPIATSTTEPTIRVAPTTAPSSMPTVAAHTNTPWWQAPHAHSAPGGEVCQTVRRVFSVDDQLYLFVNPFLTDLRDTAPLAHFYNSDGREHELAPIFGRDASITRAVATEGWDAFPAENDLVRRVSFGFSSSGKSWIGASSVCMTPSSIKVPMSSFITCQKITARSHDADGNLLLETLQNAGEHAVLIAAADAALFASAKRLCFRSSAASACPSGHTCTSRSPTPAPAPPSAMAPRARLVDSMVDGGPVPEDAHELRTGASCDSPSSLFGVVGSVSLCAAMCKAVPECSLFKFGTGATKGHCYMQHSRGGQAACPEGWVRDSFRSFELAAVRSVPATTAPTASETHSPTWNGIGTRPWYAKVSDGAAPEQPQVERNKDVKSKLPNPSKVWSPHDPNRHMWWQGRRR